MVIAKNKKFKPHMMNTVKSNMDYNTWTPGPEPPNNQEQGVARAVFIPQSNSLPFEERQVSLENSVMIGRNVYRATPSSSNTIFDCRVLSRHHATLYYEKGHFYLVDNKSSNGTFINNNRCSISKEQEPHEVFSGDIVQFGISVVENGVNSEKNTFPPVVAMLKLFHPDGKEAKLAFNPTMTAPLHLKELYQLNSFVQEAMQREASLETRLRTLRECVERTRAESQASWNLFVGEQRLLMRVRTLESMLAHGKQPDPHTVAQLLDDKRNYQEVAVESLRAAHEQRLALEESLERRNREAAALQHHNCSLRLAANNALAELQKLAARCERKMCAARIAIAAAEEREAAVRAQLPLACSVQNGEAKMLIVSSDGNRVIEEEKRSSTLEDAVRSLPDYIKLLLPQQLLTKIGMKTISSEGKSAKEFDLILQSNNLYQAEKQDKEDGELSAVSGSGEEKAIVDTLMEDDSFTDDEKLRLNHVTDTTEVDPPSPADGDGRPDNNANSEPDNREESPLQSKGHEYANILRVMAGLNDEIKTLRERVAVVANENEQLRVVRDELLASQPEPRADNGIEEDAATYRSRITELQAQLTRSTAAEEANHLEMQRLAATTAEMHAELAFRPTRSQVDDLTATVLKLRALLDEKQQRLETLTAPVADKATDTSHSLEDLTKTHVVDVQRNISEEIDEMFKLDFDDEEDETSDSVATEANISATDSTETLASCDKVRKRNVSQEECVRLDDEQRLLVTLQNGSLHALEEELVRTKERWAEACGECARLSAQLTAVQVKPRLLAPVLFVAVPLVAALCYWLLLPHLS